MLTAFNDISTEAKWDDAKRVEVLMNFIDSLVSQGKVTTDDFLDFVDEECANEKED